MDKQAFCKNLYVGDMTMWMFEQHPRFDLHLRQFAKRYELECKKCDDYISSNERDKSKELVLT